MTALLELPAVRERVQPVSVDLYHRLGEAGELSKNVELLRGIIVRKMSKSPLHEVVCQKLMLLLMARVPAGFQVRREGPLTLRDSEPEPDLSVIRGDPDDWAAAHPTTAQLVVEVAVTSGAVDEGKADIYAEAGVPEFWLVRPASGTVDVYRNPTSAGYLSKHTVSADGLVRCQSIPGLEVPVEAILPARSSR